MSLKPHYYNHQAFRKRDPSSSPSSTLYQQCVGCSDWRNGGNHRLDPCRHLLTIQTMQGRGRRYPFALIPVCQYRHLHSHGDYRVCHPPAQPRRPRSHRCPTCNAGGRGWRGCLRTRHGSVCPSGLRHGVRRPGRSLVVNDGGSGMGFRSLQ